MITTPDAARHARASRLDRARIDDIVEQLTQRGLSVSCQLSLATDLVRECEALLRGLDAPLLPAAEDMLP